jgi:hypothetical protein
MSLDNDDIKQLIAILQRGLTSDSDDDIISNSEEVSTKPKKRSKSIKKSKNNDIQSNNKFDTMLEKSMHKEDIEIDKRLAKHPPSIRAREFASTKATCRVCGRTEEVNPSLVFEGRYKCNKCSREPG